MDNSQSVTDNIYPSTDGISNSIEKDLPTSQSTGSISDGDDDERNLDHQEDSTSGIILPTNVRITFIPNILLTKFFFITIIKIVHLKEKSESSHNTYAEYLKIIALSLSLGNYIITSHYTFLIIFSKLMIKYNRDYCYCLWYRRPKFALLLH